MTTSALPALNRRSMALKMRMAALSGQAGELTRRKMELNHSISMTKALQEIAPDALTALEYLQEQAHAKAVGKFQELLSTFVAEVVPEAGDIVLELGTYSGAPSLEVFIEKGDGEREGILDGNGGGLTNVVVTGLAYAALSRTNNRALMVLDEPDCWLSLGCVPAFTKVIADVANPTVLPDGTTSLGYQTLMVSHNPISAMDPGAHVHQLLDVDGVPYVTTVSGARAWEDDTQEGIRWMELENVRRHSKTRIELSPGLNVLTGGINLGKSTLLYAGLRAMAYGESDDTLLQHQQNNAFIRLGIENGIVLEMERRRKGSPKVTYRLFQHGELLHEARPATKGSVPDFITKALRIVKVDGLDIQLRSQKEPIFLLNEPSTRQARLLSIGTEAGMLQDLMEAHRLRTRRDKDRLKQEEIELNLINRKLTVLTPLESMQTFSELFGTLIDSAQATEASIEKVTRTLTTLSIAEPKVRLAAAFEPQLHVFPVVPAHQDGKLLRRVVDVLAKNQHVAALPDVPTAPVAPSLVDTAKLNKLATDIARTQHIARLPAVPAAPVVPTLHPTDSLTRIAGAIAKTQHISAIPSLPAAPVAPQLADTAKLTQLADRIENNGKAVALSAYFVKPPAIPVLADVQNVVIIGRKLAHAEKALTQVTADAAAANDSANTMRIELDALKAQIGVCPLCENHFGAHHHG